MKASVEKKIILGFLLALLTLAGTAWLSYRTRDNLVATQSWVSHAHEVIADLGDGLFLLTDAETSQRSYQYGVNAYVVKPVDFQQFLRSVKEIGFFRAIINEPPPGTMKRKS
jgi:hypothetical protein